MLEWSNHEPRIAGLRACLSFVLLHAILEHRTHVRFIKFDWLDFECEITTWRNRSRADTRTARLLFFSPFAANIIHQYIIEFNYPWNNCRDLSIEALLVRMGLDEEREMVGGKRERRYHVLIRRGGLRRRLMVWDLVGVDWQFRWITDWCPWYERRLPERISLGLNGTDPRGTERQSEDFFRLEVKEGDLTLVNVDASTNSCELSEMSVKPTSSPVKIMHWRSS